MEQTLADLFQKALYQSPFQKCVFSRPKNQNELKTVATLFLQKASVFLQCERFTKDGKATQKNIPYQNAKEHLLNIACDYRQINLITEGGNAEVKISEKGKIWILDRINKSSKAPNVAPHNREKEYLVDTKEAFDFLYGLGIVDKDGRILDKKRAKFKQINRFLEFMVDILPHISTGKTITIWDLCCGKSYLTFAVYFYLAKQLKLPVQMYAVDRKADVISCCSVLAQKLGYDGLHFACMDIHDFSTDATPDLVLSLHACDIATDIVLSHAIKHDAKVILSSPCCHHEMFEQLECPDLQFIQKHSILKQKLCDAATDALRSLYLEASGYQVQAIEFVDPDETPKNVLLRACKKQNFSSRKRETLLTQYQNICTYLQVNPYLKRLMDTNT